MMPHTTILTNEPMSKIHVLWKFTSEIARNKLDISWHKQQLLNFAFEGGALFGVVVQEGGGRFL